MAERSPIVYFMGAALLIMGAGGAYIGWDNYTRTRERQRVAAAELAAADAARAQQIREEARAQRAADESRQQARNETAIQQALRQLGSNQPMTQCDGALALGRLRARDQRHALETLLEHSRFTSVKNCAAGALADLGETTTALNAYERWARGTDRELHRLAIGGFGKIGPAAGSIAVPYLTDALKAPHWDMRYLATDSAAKIGPAGQALLQMASGDADARVRARAAQALGRR